MVDLPVATEKMEGPYTCLVFLGIEIDTEVNQLHLLEEKVERLQTIISKWMQTGTTHQNIPGAKETCCL